MKRFQAKTFSVKPRHFDKTMPMPKTTLVPEDWESNTCGGCGSKLAASTLTLSLNKLDIPNDDAVLLGVKDGEDCALTRFSEHSLCLQSIDQFRSFISDPYLLGQIATQHALSDIYAMGGVAKNRASRPDARRCKQKDSAGRYFSTDVGRAGYSD